MTTYHDKGQTATDFVVSKVEQLSSMLTACVTTSVRKKGDGAKLFVELKGMLT